ncbi:uncharacterized protein OCT59_001377 [Rhizophagus irregularis]|uniref:uncharacterized protein n=1 Tax=Rhizophagus irregularis TaxID=588596 RepID=UPI00331AE6D1|nr:hypothetical protein OCT59_001377 [Rhizophagus irregularis]
MKPIKPIRFVPYVEKDRKKRVNVFIYFRNVMISRYRPTIMNTSVCSRMMLEKWNALPETEKNKWREKLYTIQSLSPQSAL